MTRYLWDTNVLSDYFRDNTHIFHKTVQVGIDQIAIASITLEEIVRGRMAQITAARNEQQRAFALRLLKSDIMRLTSIAILDYTDQAAGLFDALRPLNRRMSSQDLRIATIALHFNLTLVTRNTRDFAAIAGLAIADWTQPSA